LGADSIVPAQFLPPIPSGVELQANKGAAGGYTPLDAGSKVEAKYLPSYVDDVVEAANLAAFPATGETGKIYVALDSGMTYRWSGTTYVAISDKVTSTGITDSTVIGRALVTAPSELSARNTIDAASRQALTVDAASAAAFAPVREKFKAPLDGLYLSRSVDDYNFMIGLGNGRMGVFSLPKQVQSLSGVAYTNNCLRGYSIQSAMLSQDDGFGTYAGPGTWIVQPQPDPVVGYQRKDLVVTTTAGSLTVNVTTGTILPQDLGRRVVITGAGASGGDLTTNVTTFVNSTTFTTGTAASTSGTGLNAVVYPTYRMNDQAGATATWVSPANTTIVGLGVVIAQNGGLGKVTVSGATSGEKTANLLKTAQAVVDSGRYPNTILVANGGTLNPTDRVIDYYSGGALTYYDQRVAVADTLPADTYTVTITGTGYKAAAASGARIYVDRFAYGFANTVVTDSGVQLFTTHDLSCSFPSAWEMAMDCKPATGSTWTFIGQAAHQLENQQTITTKVDGNNLTLTNGQVKSCGSAQVIRTTKLYHPDSGAALASPPLGTVTYTYTLTASQLAVSVDITFNVETDVRIGYVMCPLAGAKSSPTKIDRAVMESFPRLLTCTASGQPLGPSFSSFFYGWDSTGNAGAGIYIPDYHGFTNGFASDVGSSYVEDRLSPPATKGYFPWVGGLVSVPRRYKVGERQRYTAIYFGNYFEDTSGLVDLMGRLSGTDVGDIEATPSPARINIESEEAE
jgi:hypothetical protein